MVRDMEDLLGFTSALKNIQDMFTKPQVMQGIERLSQSIEGLNRQLASMNSTVLQQNAQVQESIRQTKDLSQQLAGSLKEQNRQLGEAAEQTRKHTEALRKELEKLNEVSGKTHGVLERMDKSSEVMENLTRVGLALAGIGTWATVFQALTAYGTPARLAIWVSVLLAIGILYLLQSIVFAKRQGGVNNLFAYALWAVAFLEFTDLIYLSDLFGFGERNPFLVPGFMLGSFAASAYMMFLLYNEVKTISNYDTQR